MYIHICMGNNKFRAHENMKIFNRNFVMGEASTRIAENE